MCSLKEEASYVRLCCSVTSHPVVSRVVVWCDYSEAISAECYGSKSPNYDLQAALVATEMDGVNC